MQFCLGKTTYLFPLATYCHAHYHLHPFHFMLFIALLSNTQQVDLLDLYLAVQNSPTLFLVMAISF